MAKFVTRTINLFALHGRTREGLLDYGQFFQRVSQLDPRSTSIAVTSDLVYSLDRIQFEDALFTARVVASSPDETPTYFDYHTGQLEQGETPAGKWMAKVARIAVDSRRDGRVVALEASRAGVSATLLERYFARLAKQHAWSSSLVVDLNPIPSPSLQSEIEGLTRIREAAVVATRPNFDWDDTNDRLAELAAESGGHVAEAVVRAGRKESLSKRSGILGIIIGSLAMSTPNLKTFRVVGRPKGSNKDVTLSSARNQRRTFVDIDPTAPIGEHDRVVFDAANDLIEHARSERRTDPATGN